MKKFTEAEKELIWNRHKVWVQVKHIAREMGRLSRSLRKLICTPGGIRPRPRVRSELRLSCDEREEIPLGLSGGCRSGRLPRVLPMPLTMSREVNAKGGRRGYRALKADDAASGRAETSAGGKDRVVSPFAGQSAGREVSPEEISGWLARTYPNNPWSCPASMDTVYATDFFSDSARQP